MAKDNETDAQAFKVVDHRRFNPDGSEKDYEGEKTPLPRSPEADPSAGQKDPLSKTSEPSREAGAEHPEPGQISFSDLVLSLAASAQIHLGVSPSPFSQQVEKDLSQAAQNIDLLGILEKKTKGNLSAEEAQLLEAILADLRMRYVEEMKK